LASDKMAARTLSDRRGQALTTTLKSGHLGKSGSKPGDKRFGAEQQVTVLSGLLVHDGGVVNRSGVCGLKNRSSMKVSGYVRAACGIWGRTSQRNPQHFPQQLRRE
jgi:hypothetical protein